VLRPKTANIDHAGREVGEQREFRAQRDTMRKIAQEEIAVDRADPRPIDALLDPAKRAGRR
jgi:hypothetical protein